MRVPSPRRTVARLAVCQVLLLTNAVLMVAVNALAGFALAPSRRLATIPVVTYVLGAAMSTLPASFFMRHARCGHRGNTRRGRLDRGNLR